MTSSLTAIPAVTRIDPLPLAGAPQGSNFSQVIASLPRSGGDGPAATHEEQVEKQVQTWVATTFFGTLLKQMHDSPFKSDLFTGGRGGEAFGSLYDQQLAQKMASGIGQRLVHSIARSMLPQKSPGSNASAKVKPAAAQAQASQKAAAAANPNPAGARQRQAPARLGLPSAGPALPYKPGSRQQESNQTSTSEVANGPVDLRA